MKKYAVVSLALCITIALVTFFQISSGCYSKKEKIEFDLKDLESDSVDYANCLNLEDKIEIYNQRRDLKFSKIIC